MILSAGVVDTVVLSCVSLSGREEDGFEARLQNCKKRVLSSSCLPVCVCLSAWNNSAPTGRIFMEFDTCVFFENALRKFVFD